MQSGIARALTDVPAAVDVGTTSCTGESRVRALARIEDAGGTRASSPEPRTDAEALGTLALAMTRSRYRMARAGEPSIAWTATRVRWQWISADAGACRVNCAREADRARPEHVTRGSHPMHARSGGYAWR